MRATLGPTRTRSRGVRITRARATACGTAALLMAGCGGGGISDSGTRSFVGKTNDVVLYVTWNRDANDLTGAFTQGALNEDRQTVATSRVALTGTVRGSGVTLNLQNGDTSTLTGTLDGETLRLEYLRPGAGVTTVELAKGDAGTFNAAVAVLSDRADQAKADQQSAAAETAERDRVGQHSQAVLDDLQALRSATLAARTSKSAAADSGDASLRGDLAAIKLRAQATLRAPAGTVCTSASTVQTDVGTLETKIATLANRRATSGDSAGKIDAAVRKLAGAVATLQSDETKYLPDDAPTGTEVNRALRAARRRLHTLGTRSGTAGGAAVDPNAIIDEARRLRDLADAACRAGGD